MAPDRERVFAITRPHRNLMWLYTLKSLFFPPLLLPLYFRYHTLRYRFDEEGVHASWGVLFRREILLTYARIQDIHVSRNIVERWLGIGTIEIQTASGSARAEMTIEGIVELEEVRDFLYTRMRGHRGGHAPSITATPDLREGNDTRSSSETVVLVREIRDELRRMREHLESAGARDV